MDYGSYIAQQNQAIADAQNAYNTASQAASGAKGSLDEFSKTQKSASDFYSGAENELGVQGARDTAAKSKQALNLTQGLINNLPNSVTGRTQGSLVTEAQRQKLLQNEMNPLSNQFNIQGAQYNDQQNALNALLGQAAQKSGLQYQSQTDKYNQLNDLYKTLLGQQNTAQSQLGSAQEMRNFYLQQQEAVRQFNEQLAQSRAQAAAQAAEAARNRQLQLSLDNRNRSESAAAAAEAKARQDAIDEQARHAREGQEAWNTNVANKPRATLWDEFWKDSTILRPVGNWLGGLWS